MLKTLTQDIAYATLDDIIVRTTAQEQSGTFFKDNPPPVFVDEIQKAPELFEQIKMFIDRDHKKGQFFMCGSQQFKMMKGVSESLSGRIGLLTLQLKCEKPTLLRVERKHSNSLRINQHKGF